MAEQQTAPEPDDARDVPPEILAMADAARIRFDHLIGGAPLALVVKAYRAGRDHGAAAERITTAAEIALDIRRELVCCDVYQRDHDTERAGETHAICFWGEAGARIAESHAQAPELQPETDHA